MEKRVIIAVILSFAVLYAFRTLYTPPAPSSDVPAVQTPTPPAPSAPAPATPNPPSVEKTETPPPAPQEDIQASKSEDLVFETELYTATISNTGGGLKSVRLKAYKDAKNQP